MQRVLAVYFAAVTAGLAHWSWQATSPFRHRLDVDAVEDAIEAAHSVFAAPPQLLLRADGAAYAAECEVKESTIGNALRGNADAAEYNGSTIRVTLSATPLQFDGTLSLFRSEDDGSDAPVPVRFDSEGNIAVGAPCSAGAAVRALHAVLARVVGPGADAVGGVAAKASLLRYTQLDLRVALVDAAGEGTATEWQGVELLRAAASHLRSGLEGIAVVDVSVRHARSALRPYRGRPLRAARDGAVSADALLRALRDGGWDADPLVAREPTRRTLHMQLVALAPPRANASLRLAHRRQGDTAWASAPAWGCAALAPSAGGGGRRRVVSADALEAGFAALLACARHSLGLPAAAGIWDAALAGAGVAPPPLVARASGAAAAPLPLNGLTLVEAAVLRRLRAHALALAAATALEAMLSDAAGEAGMQITPALAKRAEAAAAALRAAARRAATRAGGRHGTLASAEAVHEAAREALEAAESALRDGSALPLPAFPSDYLYAIYLPLVAPLLGPAIASLRGR